MTKSVSSHDELLRLITTNRISLRQTQYTVGPVSESDSDDDYEEFMGVYSSREAAIKNAKE